MSLSLPIAPSRSGVFSKAERQRIRDVQTIDRTGKGSNHRHMSSEPNSGCCELDEGEKVCGQFVIACCDPTELFEFVEETLDPIAQFVKQGARVSGGNLGSILEEDI